MTVAKAFHKLEDDIEDLGAQLVKQVSIKSANEAGDGTTTSTLIATELVKQGLKEIRQGVNAVEIKNEIDNIVNHIVDEIKELATDDHQKNRLSKLRLYQVTTIRRLVT